MKRLLRTTLPLMQDLVATYWFLPSCLAVAAFGLSFLMPWLDETVPLQTSGPLGWAVQTQPDGARAVLTVVAGSIIGVTGTVFSITIVAVSFASSNFGPRLIANFMRDRGTQLTLGVFISTFVYCVLVLRRIHDAADDADPGDYGAFVPHLSILVALALALASVGVLIFFIHHIPETISIDRLVAKIGRRLIADVANEAAEAPDRQAFRDEGDDSDDTPWDARIAGRARLAITAPDAGFVKRIDMDELLRLAKEHDLLLRVQYRAGDFALRGATLIDVYDETGDIDDDIAERMRESFRIATRRSPEQDWLFLADELVEVIGRALSPGINDPVTAMTSLDWLASALIAYLDCEGPGKAASDRSRVRQRTIDFERLVATTFDSPRQYIAADRLCALHALKLIAEVATHADADTHRAALRRRLDDLLGAGQDQLASEVDRRDLIERHRLACAYIDDADRRERLRDDGGWAAGSG